MSVGSKTLVQRSSSGDEGLSPPPSSRGWEPILVPVKVPTHQTREGTPESSLHDRQPGYEKTELQRIKNLIPVEQK